MSDVVQTVAHVPLLALVGNPNSGKTTLFNALTGLSARVGNYPGITVEHREGTCELSGKSARVLDLPGTYSLVPRSDDEAVAVRGVFGRLPDTSAPDLVIAVVDATAIDRNLYLVTQLRELPVPLIVALTMMDTMAKDGLTVDVEALSQRIGVPVIPAPAIRGGANALKAAVRAALDKPVARLPLNPPGGVVIEPAELAVGQALADGLTVPGLALGSSARAMALWALGVRAGGVTSSMALPDKLRARVDALSATSSAATAIINARYERVRAWTLGVVRANDVSVVETPSQRFTRRVDAVALHPVLGPVLMLLVFLALFQSLFSGASVVMDVISTGMKALGAFAGAHIPESTPAWATWWCSCRRSRCCSCFSRCSRTRATSHAPRFSSTA
jgi:ferrous iron transport protein B